MESGRHTIVQPWPPPDDAAVKPVYLLLDGPLSDPFRRGDATRHQRATIGLPWPRQLVSYVAFVARLAAFFAFFSFGESLDLLVFSFFS